jgi:hypothetical protein
LRTAERHFQRPVDRRFDLISVAQLVIPTRKLAQQAALIERLLSPVDEIARLPFMPSSVSGVRPPKKSSAR